MRGGLWPPLPRPRRNPFTHATIPAPYWAGSRVGPTVALWDMRRSRAVARGLASRNFRAHAFSRGIEGILDRAMPDAEHAETAQSAASSIRSSTGTRTNSSRAPLSSIRVSRCIFCRLRSSDSSRPVRRRTSFTATSLKPGFLCQGTPAKGMGQPTRQRKDNVCSGPAS